MCFPSSSNKKQILIIPRCHNSKALAKYFLIIVCKFVQNLHKGKLKKKEKKGRRKEEVKI